MILLAMAHHICSEGNDVLETQSWLKREEKKDGWQLCCKNEVEALSGIKEATAFIIEEKIDHGSSRQGKDFFR